MAMNDFDYNIDYDYEAERTIEKQKHVLDLRITIEHLAAFLPDQDTRVIVSTMLKLINVKREIERLEKRIGVRI